MYRIYKYKNAKTQRTGGWISSVPHIGSSMHTEFRSGKCLINRANGRVNRKGCCYPTECKYPKQTNQSRSRNLSKIYVKSMCLGTFGQLSGDLTFWIPSGHWGDFRGADAPKSVPGPVDGTQNPPMRCPSLGLTFRQSKNDSKWRKKLNRSMLPKRRRNVAKSNPRTH